MDYVLNRELIAKKMRLVGISSLGELAARLGLHRNTLHHFLSGASVLPRSVAELLDILRLTPSEALVIKTEVPASPWQPIAALVTALFEEFPDLTFVLFGSRAKGKARKYSDFDLGVYSSAKIATARFLKITQRKEDHAENLPFSVDLVNLTQAEESFVRSIGTDAILLAGNRCLWESFLASIYEKQNTSTAEAKI
jgi:uncharacterized protein